MIRRFGGVVILIGVMVNFVLPTSAWSQEPKAAPTARAAHPFFDVPNLVWTAVESGALVADGIYTQRGLKRYPDTSREADPVARWFVDRGWPGQIAGGALVVTAGVGLRYWLHKKRHHRVERLLPLVLTVYGTVGAIHNARELRKTEPLQ